MTGPFTTWVAAALATVSLIQPGPLPRIADPGGAGAIPARVGRPGEAAPGPPVEPPGPAGRGPAGRGPAGVWPLSPRPSVVSPFAPPAAAWEAGHRGVDLLGRTGQPVRAALSGRISFTGTIAGRGVVVVDHGGFRTTYEPVAGSRRVGDAVAGGEVLGRLQLPRSHCYPRACLHWGLLVADQYRDPLGLLGLSPVRLLPLGTAD